jgi:hypothetical protein
MGEGIPFLALLAVSPLEAVILLQAAGDMAPFRQLAGLVDVFEQPVLLLGPHSLLSHFILLIIVIKSKQQKGEFEFQKTIIFRPLPDRRQPGGGGLRNWMGRTSGRGEIKLLLC